MFNKILKEQREKEGVEEKKIDANAKQPIKMRQIIIETDGNVAKIVKAEVAGTLELKSILQGLSDSLK